MSSPVLIVEPQPEVAFLIESELHGRGYAVNAAPDVEAARAAIAAGPYDLIVIESVLPGGGGVFLCREVRGSSLNKAAPIVLLDSHNVLGTVPLEEARARCDVNALFRTPLTFGSFVESLVSLAGDTTPPLGGSASELSRSVAEVSIPKLIRAFYDFRMSGVLTVRGGGAMRSLYFKDGTARFASSTVPEDSIGELLCREGPLAVEDRDRVLKAQDRSTQRFGRLAMDLSLITPQERTEFLARQLVRIAGTMFRLDEGEVTIGKNPRSADANAEQPVHPFHMIRGGIETGFPKGRLERRLSPGDRYLVPVPERTFSVAEIGFSQGELEFLFKIDGTRTINELRTEPGLPARINAQIIASLIFARMVYASDTPSEPDDRFERDAQAAGEEEFQDDFFRHPWDRAEAGVQGTARRTYQLLDVSSPGNKPLRELLTAEGREQLRSQAQERRRFGTPGALLFLTIGVVAVGAFVLFLLSVKPALMVDWAERLGGEKKPAQADVIRPTFVKARRLYEEGMKLMESDQAGDLREAAARFEDALAIDPLYAEAAHALRTARSRLGRQQPEEGR